MVAMVLHGRWLILLHRLGIMAYPEAWTHHLEVIFVDHAHLEEVVILLHVRDARLLHLHSVPFLLAVVVISKTLYFLERILVVEQDAVRIE